jgi:hypothetical protein
MISERLHYYKFVVRLVEPESSPHKALLGVLSAGDRVVRANAFR